jgi:hypothetical protein
MKSTCAIALTIILLIANSCSDKETGADERTLKINEIVSSPWTNAVVTHSTDGDLSFQYEDFSIAFIKNPGSSYDGDFIVTHGGYAFEEHYGKWKLDEVSSQIILSTGKQMEFVLTENILRLEFTVDNTSGRTAGVSGHFIFELQKEI